MNTIQYDNQVILFAPSLPCRGPDHCERKTTFALLEMSGNDITMLPLCSKHGYFYEVPQADEYASIERFVVGSYGNQGHAKVIAQVHLAQVPDYEPIEDAGMVDSAWSVLYTDSEGNGATLHVVWFVEALEFELYN